MLPLKDHNPTSRFPYLTVLLIAANVFVYFLVQPHQHNVDEAEFSFKHAAIPCEVVHGRPLDVTEIEAVVEHNQADACEGDSPSAPPEFPGKSVYVAILYSMFLHGSLLHIGGNMLFLWVFGNNIEDVMGTLGFVAFYLASGIVAAAAHIAAQPNSTVPVIGASGAIAGVMGAYLVLFPNVRIRSLFILFFLFIRDVRAKWWLGVWFVFQFFTSANEGVAWVAHVGGFVFGALVALAFRDRLRARSAVFAGPPDVPYHPGYPEP